MPDRRIYFPLVLVSEMQCLYKSVHARAKALLLEQVTGATLLAYRNDVQGLQEILDSSAQV